MSPNTPEDRVPGARLEKRGFYSFSGGLSAYAAFELREGHTGDDDIGRDQCLALEDDIPLELDGH